ncbi:MAG: hypothetical protein KU37_02270 [Sulfuricurvum sp. PC08-66]|nr:MAG: hypothetical protein KU37_02270 [Sulfuricurvum sp. PC08-66]
MRHPVNAFERHAHHYDSVNHIQQKIATHVVAGLGARGERILDIGCGTGAVYGALGRKVDHFLALDLSVSMLERHPKAVHIETLCADFDTLAWEAIVQTHRIDTLYSASSLQWSRDFVALYGALYRLHLPFSLGVLTAHTFGELHALLGIESPIVRRQTIEEVVATTPDVTMTFETMQTHFASTQSLLRYIQNSGVATTHATVSPTKLRALARANTLRHLSFEVAYLTRR